MGAGISEYNIVDYTPFKRDPLRELSEACAEAGIKFDKNWKTPDEVSKRLVTCLRPHQEKPRNDSTGEESPDIFISRKCKHLRILWSGMSR